jgi:Protein of unknown function (DUF1071)
MNASNSNSFVQLAAINVNEHVEKKNGLSYLSWAWAVDTLLRADPTATWSYRDFNGTPHLTLPDGTAMVFCNVTAFGQTRTMQLPVMDHRNRAIANPDSFAINTAMQRCLVKAIALAGLGLYIYAGEDLPEGDKPADEATPPKAPVTPITGKFATATQLRFIERLIDETGSDLGKVLDFFGVSALSELTSHMASRAITSLEKSRRAA